jgi:hypothetical protein
LRYWRLDFLRRINASMIQSFWIDYLVSLVKCRCCGPSPDGICDPRDGIQRWVKRASGHFS